MRRLVLANRKAAQNALWREIQRLGGQKLKIRQEMPSDASQRLAQLNAHIDILTHADILTHL